MSEKIGTAEVVAVLDDIHHIRFTPLETVATAVREIDRNRTPGFNILPPTMGAGTLAVQLPLHKSPQDALGAAFNVVGPPSAMVI